MRLKSLLVIITILTVLIAPSDITKLTVQAEEQKKLEGNNIKALDIIRDQEIVEKKYSELQEEGLNYYNGDILSFTNVSDLVKDSSTLQQMNGEEVVGIEHGESIDLYLTVPTSAAYQIGVEYYIKGDQVLPTQTEVKINEEIMFYELRNIVFESKWENPSEFSIDKYGNEIIPQPIKVDEWQSKYLIDTSYREVEPFYIPLEKGENKISLTSTEGNLYIKSVYLKGKEALPPIPDDVHIDGNGYIEIEAEQHTYKNDSSIRSAGVYNPEITPFSSEYIKLNHISGDSFKNAGQKVTFEFEVEESGYYYLATHYQQKAKPDFPVFMDIMIDDQIPNEALQNFALPYQSSYQLFHFQLDNKKIPIYLEEGKHTLSFQLTLGPIKQAIEEIEQISTEIQSLSLELTNLIGPNPDRNRDLKVEEYIPDTEKLLLYWADKLDDIYGQMKTFNRKADEIGAYSSLVIASEQLKSIAEEVDKLVVRKSELSTGTNSITAHLGNLLQEINNNGISIDKVYLYQRENDIDVGIGFFEKQFGKMKRLLNSFGNQDYAVNNVNPDHLQVWVNRPRQYIEIMQQLIDEQFTPETGVKVDLSLMPDQNKLILANAAGEAPDVALGVNYALPFEMAIRGALEDISQLDGFEEIKSYYPEGMLIPATVQEGVYALPDTMNFWVMFYRRDILERLELPVPNTIDEVRSYLPELQRKGMNFFYPTAGMEGMKIFAGTMPIIYQNDGRFYGETIDRTLLNENSAIQGMRELTELFTIYNAPYDVPSFYQQFRDGSIPIGISDYYMYNLILNAAPEIQNQWEIALVPGVKNDSGEIERWSAGGAESNIMFRDSDKKEAAWEFLKWWASTDVQIAFGNALQITYGKEYMWNTANIEAYNGLPWSQDHKEVIFAQADWITEVPRVPGSYMLERELSNAYNSIVLDGENLRTAIDLASKRINRETERKLEEFGYLKNGELIDPYLNPELYYE